MERLANKMKTKTLDITKITTEADMKQFLLNMGAFRQGNVQKYDFAYNNFEEFLLENGQQFKFAKLLPYEEKIIKEAKEFLRPKVKACFANAQALIMSDFSDVIQYVEGYATAFENGVPIHHAFNTINGKIIDLTWEIFEKDTMKNETYFGCIINKIYVQENIFIQEQYQSMFYFRRDNPLLKNKFNKSTNIPESWKPQ